MEYLKGMWAGLDNMGRMVFVGCVAVVLIAAMVIGVDLSWVPGLLAGG